MSRTPMSGSFRPPTCYIEYWGLEGAEYDRRRAEKMRVYRAHKLNLIELTEADITKLDDPPGTAPRIRYHGVLARRPSTQ
jgi:hypothetical protein